MVRFLWLKDDGLRDCAFEFHLCLDSASDLVTENRWWKSPEFLLKHKKEWPQEENVHSDNKNALKEIVQNPATTTHALITSTQVQQIGVHQTMDANRYSSWKKLLQITAYILRFTRRSRV